MKVKLINHTPDPERTVAVAARLCYSAAAGDKIRERLSAAEANRFLGHLLEIGHLSPVEHVSFTFSIEGSRAFSHQLVRHRIASYSQKSQRYVSEADFVYVLPPSVAQNEEAREAFTSVMAEIRAAYSKLAALVPKEDARYVLPNACATNIICTFNGRSLLNFFRLRCCRRAQWEIREAADLMLEEVRKVAPALFAKAGPTCVSEGICWEGAMSCGRCDDVRTR
jgi:thymidylate synthase (FAD)